MLPLVREPLGEIITIFRMKGINERIADQYRGVKRSAVCFDTAGDVDRVTNDGKLQPLVAADVTLDDVAVVDADGDPDGNVAEPTAPFVPTVDRPLNVQRAARSVDGVAWALYRRAEHR